MLDIHDFISSFKISFRFIDSSVDSRFTDGGDSNSIIPEERHMAVVEQTKTRDRINVFFRWSNGAVFMRHFYIGQL